MSRRVLIVIGQVLSEPWLSITREGQFPTWLADAHKAGIPVRHSHGNRLGSLGQRLDRWHEAARWHPRGRRIVPALDRLIGSPFYGRVQQVRTTRFIAPESVAWHQDLPDYYALQRWKVIGSMATALADPEPWDVVYFTTASSYVRLGGLQERIDALPATMAYAGTRHVDAISGAVFASGANRAFSRDLVEAIVANRTDYRNDVMEDVGVGRLAQLLGADLTPWPSMNLDSLEALDRASDAELLAQFHFRLTSGPRENRQDARIMRALHARLKAISGDERVTS